MLTVYTVDTDFIITSLFPFIAVLARILRKETEIDNVKTKSK